MESSIRRPKIEPRSKRLAHVTKLYTISINSTWLEAAEQCSQATELKNDCACVTSDPVGKAVGAKIST